MNMLIGVYNLYDLICSTIDVPNSIKLRTSMYDMKLVKTIHLLSERGV